MADKTDARALPSIAIVAVHGVADQKPRESADAISALLLGLRRSRDQLSRYTSFKEVPLQIPQRAILPVRGGPMASPDAAPGDERAPHVRRQLNEANQSRVSRPSESSTVDFDFMRSLLEEYDGTDDGGAYDTVRREGKALDRAGERAADVHVYEMYWADLSRLGGGVIRLFGELYQFLFHLSDLGRQVIDFAYVENAGRPGWIWYHRLQTWATRLLTMPVPVLNLLLLAVLLSAVPGRLSPGVQPWVAYAVLALGSAAGTMLGLARRSVKHYGAWLIAPFAAALLALGAGMWIFGVDQTGRWHRFGTNHLLVLEWCAIAVVGLKWLIDAYERRRPLVWRTARPLLALTFVILVALVLNLPNSQGWMAEAAIWTAEGLFFVNGLVWLAFLLCGLGAAVAGAVLARPHAAGPSGSVNGRSRRATAAAATARITLALPAALVFVVTLSIWSAVFRLAHTVLPAMPHDPLLFRMPEDLTQDAFLNHLLHSSGTVSFVPALSVLLLAALIAAYAILPVVFTEVRPPKRHDGARRLGEWLSNGYRSAGIASWMMTVAVFVLLLGGFVDRFFRWSVWLSTRLPAVRPVFDAFAGATPRLLALLAAGTLALFAFRGPLGGLVLGFRASLDIALDVDNYLREHPRDRTPRARIATRYASLLRYLSHWRSPDGRGYSTVVFVAHSQGTIITIDLLRFLRREPLVRLDDALDRLVRPDAAERADVSPDRPPRMSLFTMGCPLRQLYAARFPHMYEWGASDPEEWTASDVDYGAAGTGAEAGAAREPNAVGRMLGVVRWVNAYRSGDYVGRDLWLKKDRTSEYERWVRSSKAEPPVPPDVAARMVTVYSDADGARRELCIGAGAHTHYWDSTAPEIAEELDLLVWEAIRAQRDDDRRREERDLPTASDSANRVLRAPG